MSDENNHVEHMTEEDKARLLDHNYDGIQEYDYPLPSWWVATFVGAIIFAIPYFIYYTLMDGPSLKDEMNSDMTVLNEVREAYAVQLTKFSPEMYAANSSVEKGLTVYEENCLACHEEGGKGDIGPNLTDAFWIHAKGTPETIYDVVVNGREREDQVMPPWGEDLSKEEIYQVVSYIMSIKNTNVPGKEPQGEKVE